MIEAWFNHEDHEGHEVRSHELIAETRRSGSAETIVGSTIQSGSEGSAFAISVMKPHSALSATMGSTLVARRAGTQQARRAMAERSTMMAKYETGS